AGPSGDSERDLSASAVSLEALGAVESSGDGLERKEPSVATILTSFENSFDKYGALSTPLYQTATFKQPSATVNGAYDYTRSGNPTRDVLQSLMAKLEKADQAFCFTSGMASLAAVTHLLQAGKWLTFTFLRSYFRPIIVVCT
uniref:Cystathionine gamma-synthase n=1 Tax=Aegilops tauschii subsp. strangulata TaxID=200361 RepID=A0A453QWD8_AEGTS